MLFADMRVGVPYIVTRESDDGSLVNCKPRAGSTLKTWHMPRQACSVKSIGTGFSGAKSVYCGWRSWRPSMSDACYCDYESPSVFHEETRKAIRPHKCGECGRRIQTGETYEHVWGVWDGVSSHHKTCPHCLGFREYVMAHVPCFCWEYENMLECATETLREYAHEAPGLWFGGARLLVNINKLRSKKK